MYTKDYSQYYPVVLIFQDQDEQWTRALEYVSLVSELNYMTQIVIMLYEDPTKDPSSEERFHVELHFSPGVNCCVDKDLPPGPGFRPNSRNNENSSVMCEAVQERAKHILSKDSISKPKDIFCCIID